MLRAAARSPAALVSCALWGFAEATRFYVVPDVLVGWIALHGVRRGVAASLWATAGAVLGGLAVHADARPQRERLTEIPGISEANGRNGGGRDGASQMATSRPEAMSERQIAASVLAALQSTRRATPRSGAPIA